LATAELIKIQSFTEETFNRLKTHFGEVKCPLHYKHDYELAIAVILSAQCTDERVNTVTPILFKKYTTLESFASAKLIELEDIIFPTGFYKNKAKNIIGFAQTLIKQYKKQMPKTIDELTKMPGIGRKTANVILNELFDISEGFVVDTHVKRVSAKLGLTKTTNADQVELDMMKKVNKKYWNKLSLYLIFLGRKFCKAHKTDCTNCPLKDICPSSEAKEG
jgi:endonuclease III